jgi:hypothetical protein
VKTSFPILGLLFAGLLSVEAISQERQTVPTVTVVGGAARPGTYEMDSELTLLKLLTLSGGVHRTWESSMVEIVRQKEQAADGRKTETILVDVRTILSGKIRDPRLQPGDVIYVLAPPPQLPTDPPITPAKRDTAARLSNLAG